MKHIGFTLICLFFAGAVSTTAEVEGLVVPLHAVSVSSAVQEIIAEIAVKEGDEVEKGDVLAKLLNKKEQLEVQRTDKIIEKTSFEAKAAQDLLRVKAIAQDEALAKQVELELAKVDREMAATKLAEKTILSPLRGIVVRKFKEPGESVDRIEKMFDLVNIDQVYLQFYLDQSVLTLIKPGAEMKVRFPALPLPNESLAKVDFIEPSIDAASGLFRVKLLMDNPGHRIRAGMRVVGEFPKLPSATVVK